MIRLPSAVLPLLLASSLALGAGCARGNGDAALAASEAAPPPLQGVCAELATLQEAGMPAPAGSEAAARVRDQIGQRLAALGARVETLTVPAPPASEPAPGEAAEVPAPAAPPAEAVGVLGELPSSAGQTGDWLVVATSIDPAADADAVRPSAAGAAVLLQLGEALAKQPLPYRVALAFLDREHGSGADALLGSRVLLHTLAASGALEHVRALVYVEHVGAPDATIARDVRSLRVYRERVFRAAAAAGHGAVFPAGQPYADVWAGHRVFEEAGFRRFVVIADAREDAADQAGSCTPARVDAVEDGLAAGLRDLAGLLARVDEMTGRSANAAAATEAPAPAAGASGANDGPDAAAGAGAPDATAD